MILETLKPKTKRTGRRVLCKCDICGQDFIDKYSERYKRKHHFCSFTCYKLFIAIPQNNTGFGKKNLLPPREQLGELNPNWRGGRTKHEKGYILIRKPEHPLTTKLGYVLEHRLIMEQYLGRYLNLEEIVHHINGDVSDNRIENLILFKNQAEHTKFHKGMAGSNI